MVITDLVGMPVPIVALVCRALESDASQVKVSPLCTVAINILPKLSKDQFPGSMSTLLDSEASPHPMYSLMFVTVEPSE